jgi:hypothetical protein
MAKPPLQEQPIEIEDEYKLGLEADVDDESAEEATAEASFSITSYGADYTVDTILKRLKTEAFFVPTFQRQFVWSQRHASRFVESLLMGLPVPGIFLYKDEHNRHLVVDGQQRLRTLQFFYNGIFLEKNFRLIGVSPQWENKTYDELETSDKLKLDDSIVHATIFQQDEPKDNLTSLYFVFERINSGGIRLSPQEIRNCISESPVLDLVRRLNDDDSWRTIFGQKRQARLKDQELVLRALAMIETRDSYFTPMRDFLNAFASDRNKVSVSRLRELDALFKTSIELVLASIGKGAFRPSRALNAAVFEAVVVGIAARLTASNDVAAPSKVRNGYDRLLTDQTFMNACNSATATNESVRTRHRLSIDAFKSV